VPARDARAKAVGIFMPTGLPLDFEALLAPLGDSEPAGSSVYFEMRAQLEDLRREVNPDEVDTNDPAAPQEVKRADWPRVEELTREALTATSKDLRLAGYLLEALVKRYGLAGLRDGLRLLREMLDQCWDRMYPSIEGGDVEVRAGLFNSLDDQNTRGRMPFPQVIRTLPILGTGANTVSFQDWKTSQEAGQDELAATVARAIQATPPERGGELAALVDECLREVDQLAKTLEARIGPETTHLPNVRAAVQDCQRVVRLVEQKSGGARPEEGQEGDIQGSGGAPRSAGTAQSRAEAYRQLADAAALLQRLEPHSPIPYLVQRAVELGSLPFPQLMKALIRDANVLTELNRELGIKAEETT
jgi:type VI secretion system protein ImpA